jgi:hypothetical protein
LSPEDFIVSMDALVRLKVDVNGALLQWVGAAIGPGMMLRRVHIFPEQLVSMIVSEQVCCRPIAENTSAIRLAAKDAFSGGVEHQPDSGIKRRDLLIGLHVLNGQRDLVGHILQEVRIGI